MGRKCDFSGLATRYNTRCTDGRIIRSGAFDDMDGKEIAIVWNHNHSDPSAVVGKGILHSVEEGCRVDGWFSDSAKSRDAKANMAAGVPMTLSIHATNLQQRGTEVLHGVIREVSLVLAGANPGAVIDHVALTHGFNDYFTEEEALINWEEPVELMHSDEDETTEETEEVEETETEETEEVEETAEEEEVENTETEETVEETENLSHSDEDETVEDVIHGMSEVKQAAFYQIMNGASNGDLTEADLKNYSEEDSSGKETIGSVFHTFTDKEKNVTFALMATMAMEKESSQGGKEMAHTNVFDATERRQSNVISHADQEAVLERAKDSSCGTFKKALNEYMLEHDFSEDELSHGFSNETMEYLFPDYKDVNGDGEPWTLTRDMGWVDKFLNATHKTPFSKVKMRFLDATSEGIKAKGYRKGDEKDEIGDVDVYHRETNPQTVYVKDSIDRDDIVDFTDFSVVAYYDKIMTMALKETLAIAMLFGDGRSKNDKAYIKPDCIRPIWGDDEHFTIYRDIDLDSTRSRLQGSNTGAYFGENFIWAESFVEQLLYAREKYKGSGSITAYMAPHTVNVMLLARDMNGRRIYGTVSELKAALNVKEIVTVEQMENLTREVTVEEEGVEVTKTKKLLALFIDEKDYNVGTNKGGEITSFKDFDIDFNKEKYLKETRCSAANIKPYSVIAMEEDVTESNNAQG